MFTWGAVGLVVVVVIVVVVVSQTSRNAPISGLHFTPKPVPATIAGEITHVPVSSFNAAGPGLAEITHPVVLSEQPALTFTGKPGIFGLFGEFCPFCAAERWAVITSLSRFGTFRGLKTMQSSPKDTAPRTQTFEFATATYSSPYVSAKLLEMFGQDKATGRHPIIKRPTKVEEKLIEKYDPTGTIPLFDIGNKLFVTGATYSPTVLKGLSRATIAAGLSHPSDLVARLILAASNCLSAGICAIDGGSPHPVCASVGVRDAAMALGLRIQRAPATDAGPGTSIEKT